LPSGSSNVNAGCAPSAITQQQPVPATTGQQQLPATTQTPATAQSTPNTANTANTGLGIPQASLLQQQAPVGQAPVQAQGSPVAQQYPAAQQTAPVVQTQTAGSFGTGCPGQTPWTPPVSLNNTATNTGDTSGTVPVGGVKTGSSALQAAFTACKQTNKYFDRAMAAGLAEGAPLSSACTTVPLSTIACSTSGDVTAYLTSVGVDIKGFNDSVGSDAMKGYSVDQCIDCPTGSTDKVCEVQPATGDKTPPPRHQIGVMFVNTAAGVSAGSAAKKITIADLR
jgi:hypothetical protein